MEIPKYKLQPIKTATRGQIGLAQIKDQNHYVMIVDGGDLSDANAPLILSKDTIRIAANRPAVVPLPGSALRSLVALRSVRFDMDHLPPGLIQIVGDREMMVVQDRDRLRSVDIRSGSVEPLTHNADLFVLSWDIVQADWNGRFESIFHFDVADRTPSP
ncbi:hypothetical protein [Nitrobacter hamburgensis]|uniref:hypothetical protein n=1 Tax=Nitrobacter hamburgensis TaxID=912 RepID=UPI0012ED7BD5|nr:hypothetical protein [Nitrobacter hamburgensis]